MSELKVNLVVIGDEVLIGQTLDTNSHWIAGQLAANGIRLGRIAVVGDDIERITAELDTCWSGADVVILTGGLGPTPDDLTRQAIAQFFKVPLTLHSQLLEKIMGFYRRKYKGLPPSARQMAYLPSNAEGITNSNGAAPGIYINQDGKQLFSLPGVPFEMRGMFNDFVLMRLLDLSADKFVTHTFKTVGVGETFLLQLISPLNLAPSISVAYLPSIENGVMIKLSMVRGWDGDDFNGNNLFEDSIGRVRQSIQQFIYTEKNELLEEVIVKLLRQKQLTLAVAESCTGGLIASRLVSVPGCSEVLERGFVTYSNRAKIEMLGVDAGLLNKYGAVSEEVALAMAKGARSAAKADVGLAVTGIAGPSGGSRAKPVGLTYLACVNSLKETTSREQFIGSRNEIRSQAALSALGLLWKLVSAEEH